MGWIPNAWETERSWWFGGDRDSIRRELTQDFALSRRGNEAVIFFLSDKDIYFTLIIYFTELGIESGTLCVLRSHLLLRYRLSQFIFKKCMCLILYWSKEEGRGVDRIRLSVKKPARMQ